MADPKNPADRDANRDPLTGAPGAHPVGVGAGAAGAGAAGAAVGGVVGGPIGAAVGGAVGAVAGGLAGKGAAEAVNPTVEEEYWRNNYSSRPYAKSGSYDDFQPAYQYGWESYTRYRGRKFDEVEPELRKGWETGKYNAKLGWDKARDATRDAWHRVERALPGDFDKDGR
jgi:phage tail tape-measure protein